MARTFMPFFTATLGAALAQADGQVDVRRIGPTTADVIVCGDRGPALTGRPEIVSAGMVAPDVVVLTLRAQSLVPGTQVPYEPETGDEVVVQRQHRYLRRDGRVIGALAGPRSQILLTLDRVVGEPLDTGAADSPGTYRVSWDSQPEGVVPRAVYRKSKPVGSTRPPARQQFGMQHTIVLRLPEAIPEEETVNVNLRAGLTTQERMTFAFDTAKLRSEAVHVNQIGFRPDDPLKLAFLSFWMGTGGGLRYPDRIPFDVLDESTGAAVFSGQARLGKAADAPTNRTGADVHELDFSSLTRPGSYRIRVAGVGCSFPFEIGTGVWRKAFTASMRGLYCQRNGIALGPPHTTFVRPRAFHPDDGVTVYVSTPKLPGEDPAIRELPADLKAVIDAYHPHARFKQWVENLTTIVLPEVWGGYMDAGDWDRRPDHALMPLLLFDLADMAPERLTEWTFRTADSDDSLPDLINEALWEVDFLRRMQQPDGSVYGAIESGEHPRKGECSWQESLPVFAYARTVEVAYSYAAVAARAAWWLHTHGDEARARGYRESALTAAAWADSQPKQDDNAERTDLRCLAGAELFRLTGEARWHAALLETTRFTSPDVPFMTNQVGHIKDPQCLAAWTYLRTDRPGVDETVTANVRAALMRDADRQLANAEATDFHWAGGPGRQIHWGALSVPESQTLVRAHFLTGEEKYLGGVVLSALTGAGANPVNMCYTTGVGSRFPQHPHHGDARLTHQLLYEGVTLGGPIDPAGPRKHPNARGVEAALHPPAREWPATESFFDVFVYVPMNEFTVHQTMLPTAFVWGYLAARASVDSQ